MLDQIAKVLLVGLFVNLAHAESDLGDVIVCSGKPPAARFAYSHTFESELSVEDLLKRIEAVSPRLSAKLHKDVQLVRETLRWTNAKFKNLDGSFFEGCELQQLYQKNKSLSGEVFFVIDKPLFQALTLSEQNLFLIEMALRLKHEVLNESVNLIGVLAVEGLLLREPMLSRSNWLQALSLVGKAAASSEVRCFIPGEFFNSLFCLYESFNGRTETGSVFAYDVNQKIALFESQTYVRQMILKDGRPFSYDWGFASEIAVRYKSSLFYPVGIELEPDGSFKVHLSSARPSFFICSNQRVSLLAGRVHIEPKGCMTTASSNLQEGEAQTQGGAWVQLKHDTKLEFDSEGYLLLP